MTDSKIGASVKSSRTEIRKQRLLLSGLAAAAAISEAIYLGLARFNAIDGVHAVSTFIAMMIALFAVYGLSFLLMRRIQTRVKTALIIVMLGAALFRITMIPAGLPHDASFVELLSLVRDDVQGKSVSFDRYLLYDDDIWRYLWDGHVWANSVNPFLYAPADPRLDALAAHDSPTFWQDIRDNINHPGIPTIYPPLAQWLFRISHALAPGSVLALKMILAVFDLGTMCVVWLGLRKLRRPPAWLLLYAWNPLLIKAVAGSGHFDVLAAALLALTAYFLLVQAKLPAALAFAAASLAKLAPLILLPFVVRRIGWRKSLLVAVVVLAAHVPFLDGGTAVFSGLVRFARAWQFNSAFFLVVRALVRPFSHDPSLLARGAGLLAISAGTVWLWRRDDGQAASFPAIASHLLAMLILFSPTVMPWYLVWLLPLAVLSRATIWIWLTGLVCLSFFVMADGRERISVLAVEYGLFLAVALLLWCRKRLRTQGRAPQTAASSTPDQSLSPLYGVNP